MNIINVELYRTPWFARIFFKTQFVYSSNPTVKIKHLTVREQFFRPSIFLADWNFLSDTCLLKHEERPWLLLPLFYLSFYAGFIGVLRGNRSKSQIWDVNLFHFVEEKGFMKNLGRIPPTCSFETCFESFHSIRVNHPVDSRKSAR